MAFLYGTVSNEYDLPPNSQIRQAFYAVKALGLIENDLPTGVMRIDRNAKPGMAVRKLDPAAGEEMDQIVEQLLGIFVGGAVDDPLGVDDGVQSAQGVESALLKREQARGPI